MVLVLLGVAVIILIQFLLFFFHSLFSHTNFPICIKLFLFLTSSSSSVFFFLVPVDLFNVSSVIKASVTSNHQAESALHITFVWLYSLFLMTNTVDPCSFLFAWPTYFSVCVCVRLALVMFHMMYVAKLRQFLVINKLLLNS